MDMIMPGGLFVLDDSATTIEAAIKALAHLNLKWQVQSGPGPTAKSAIAVIERSSDTGKIWAVAALENNWSTHHRHNNAGGTEHEKFYSDFWVGVFNQPRGSMPLS
jgi:chaperone required for assembly of F1-ATPase